MSDNYRRDGGSFASSSTSHDQHMIPRGFDGDPLIPPVRQKIPRAAHATQGSMGRGLLTLMQTPSRFIALSLIASLVLSSFFLRDLEYVQAAYDAVSQSIGHVEYQASEVAQEDPVRTEVDLDMVVAQAERADSSSVVSRIANAVGGFFSVVGVTLYRGVQVVIDFFTIERAGDTVVLESDAVIEFKKREGIDSGTAITLVEGDSATSTTVNGVSSGGSSTAFGSVQSQISAIRSEIASLRNMGIGSASSLISPTPVERIVERVVQGDMVSVTRDDLNIAVNELRKEIANVSSAADQNTSAVYRAVSLTNRIDRLDNVTISNATITGSTFAGSIAGTSGSFSSLSVSTLTGTTTAEGLNITSGCFAVNGTCIDSGASSTFLGLSDTPNSYTAGSVLFTSGSAVTQDNASFFWDDTNNRLGIGTTSPYAKLSVHKLSTDSNPTGDLFAIATSTPTATTTVFRVNFQGTAIGTTFTATNGSVLSPSFRWDNDDDTGLYNFGANSIGISTGGTFRAVVDGSGNFGIASSSPWGLLSVNPNGISGPAFVIGSSTKTDFVVTNGGDVGVGTTSPSAKLHVSGSIRGDALAVGAAIDSGLGIKVFHDGSTFDGNFKEISEFRNAAGTKGLTLGYDTTASKGIITSISTNSGLALVTHDGSAWGERLSVGTTGNVGVSSTTPGARFSIHGLTSDPSFATPLFAIGSSTASATTTHLFVTRAGLVGFGTTTPLAGLHSTRGIVSTGQVGSFPDVFRSDSHFEARSTNALISVFDTTNPTSTSTESAIAWGGYDGAGSPQKTASISAVWSSTSTVSGYSALRLNATKNGGGTDAIGLTIYGGQGAKFFGFDFTGPGEDKLLIGGEVQAENMSIGTTFDSTLGLKVYHNGATFDGNFKEISEFRNAAGTNGLTLGYDNTATKGIITSVGTNSGLALVTHDGSSWGERLSIGTTGNVGIGTTSPYAKFSLHKLSTDGNPTGDLFAIATSTPTATTTVFRVNFQGNTVGATFLANDGSALSPSFRWNNDDDTGFYNFGANSIGIATGGNFHSVFNGSGNLGIGTSTPWRTLSVGGTVAFNGLTSSATGNAVCITTGKDITDAGGGTCTPSSQRFKENVMTLNSGSALDTISKMRVVTFDYKPENASPEESPASIGMIAEELEQIDTRLVDYGYDGKPLTIHFERVTGLLVQAVQELWIQIKEQGSTIASFGSRIANLESNVSSLLANSVSAISSFVSSLTVGSSDAPTGITLYDEATHDPYCLKVVNGATQITSGICSSTSSSSSSESENTESSTPTAPDTIAPTLTISGNNPAEIALNATYNDLGVVVQDNVDNNLGHTITVDGTLLASGQQVTIDTSVAGEHAIVYSATDNAGNTASSTRTVIVGGEEEAPAVDEAADETATTTDQTPSEPATADTATTTDETL